MAFIQRGRTSTGKFTSGLARVEWNGSNVLMSITEKSVAAVNAATEEAARYAVEHHPWQVRNVPGLEDTIRSHPAEVRGFEVIGTWSADFPAIFLEYGTSHAGPFPFLRPAADATYRRVLLGGIRV